MESVDEENISSNTAEDDIISLPPPPDQFWDTPVIYFPICLRNGLISAGLRPVFSHTDELCMASNYRQFSSKIYIITLLTLPNTLL